MSALGADVTALEQFAGRLRQAAAMLDGVAVGLDRRVRARGWSGGDSERFQRDWVLRHRPALVHLGRRCAELARVTDAQAAQQRRASAASGPSGPGPSGHRPGLGAAPPAPTPVLTEHRYVGGVEVRAGLVTAVLSGDVSIRELDDGRVQVTVTRTGAGGVVAAVGATTTFSVGGPLSTSTPTGAQADARARVGAVERHSWTVEPDEVAGLLARVGAAAALDPVVPSGGQAVADAGRLTGSVLDGITTHLGGFDAGMDHHLADAVRVPDPDRSERLLQIEVLAGAGATAVAGARSGGAAALLPAGQLALGGELRGGWAVEDGRVARVVELQGAVSATISTALGRQLGVALPEQANGSVGLRLELVEARDGAPEQLIVRETRSSGTTIDERRIQLDLSAAGSDALRTAARAVLERLHSGDPSGAIEVVDKLRVLPDLSEHVTVTERTSELSGTTVRAGGSFGAGVTAGLSARGQMLRVEHRG